MKVYVDKNDVDIIEDLFQATNSYECWACNRDNDLEIVSLADYTKQVRKEVCEEIREWHDEECESLDLDSDFDVGYSGALSNLWGILDQIEGKPKD